MLRHTLTLFMLKNLIYLVNDQSTIMIKQVPIAPCVLNIQDYLIFFRIGCLYINTRMSVDTLVRPYS